MPSDDGEGEAVSKEAPPGEDMNLDVPPAAPEAAEGDELAAPEQPPAETEEAPETPPAPEEEAPPAEPEGEEEEEEDEPEGELESASTPEPADKA